MAVILIDPVFKTTKNYPQLCLEECKYMVKKKNFLLIIPTNRLLIKNRFIHKYLSKEYKKGIDTFFFYVLTMVSY